MTTPRRQAQLQPTTAVVDTPWLTVTEAAQRARRGRVALLRALGDESLRGHRRGDRGWWAIHVEDLDAWMRGEKADVQIHTGARVAS